MKTNKILALSLLTIMAIFIYYIYNSNRIKKQAKIICNQFERMGRPITGCESKFYHNSDFAKSITNELK